MKTLTFFIETLDEGYTLKDNGKIKAIEDYSTLRKYLTERFVDKLQRLGQTGINNMLIEIEISENCPTQKK